MNLGIPLKETTSWMVFLGVPPTHSPQSKTLSRTKHRAAVGAVLRGDGLCLSGRLAIDLTARGSHPMRAKGHIVLQGGFSLLAGQRVWDKNSHASLLGGRFRGSPAPRSADPSASWDPRGLRPTLRASRTKHGSVSLSWAPLKIGGFPGFH